MIGNIGTSLSTSSPILYDASSYYAHNEMDLGIWRCAWHTHFRDPIYTRSYLENYPPAEPKEEWEDRNRLYSLKYNLNYSAGHVGNVCRETYVSDVVVYERMVRWGRVDANLMRG